VAPAYTLPQRTSSILRPPSSIFLAMLPAFLVAVAALLSLPLTAVGLPGTWILLAGVSLWKSLDDSIPLAWPWIGLAFAIALVAELIEFTLASRYTAKYGGSRRAGWGAIIGGIAGAIVGVPIPVVGSILGAFVGAFLGAFVAEYTVEQRHGHAGRVAWGALLGRVFATGAKVALGVVASVVLVADALF
jgi:uncharacterized protein YqgC (DUF456 family)